MSTRTWFALGIAVLVGCGSERQLRDDGGEDDEDGVACAYASDCPRQDCSCQDGSSVAVAECVDGACSSAYEACTLHGCSPVGGASSAGGGGGLGPAGSSSVAAGTGGGSNAGSGGFGGSSSASGGPNPTCVAIADHECLTCLGPSCIGSESWQYTIDLCESYLVDWAEYWACIQAANTCDQMNACKP